MTVPGIGPIIASAMVATIGDGSAFRRGRDFGAWLGLVPRQISTGDRTILGRISKRGNSYLRMLFVQAARVVSGRPTGLSIASAGGWRLPPTRMHHNVVAAALANKLTRIAWRCCTRRTYEPRTVPEAAASELTDQPLESRRGLREEQEMENGLADASGDLVTLMAA